MTDEHPFAQCTLAGMRLDAVDERGLLDHIFSSLRIGQGGWLITANLDFLRRHHLDPTTRALYDAADLRVADGMPLVWASRLQGQPLPERVAGSSLGWTIAERAAAEGRSLYLLGGTANANRVAALSLRRRLPDLRLCGHSTRLFATPPASVELDEVVREIVPLQPDVLFVGLGSPKQEQVIAALRPYLPRTWMIGVGATIAFLAGEFRRAPRWMQRSGLEWLHRLALEPRRMAKRYLVQGLPFALHLFSAALWHRLAKPRGAL
jgi:N-acetylglucosaminyldiphosphoundecaprenol N-acetyl-beta-D-mannosaminyltransferase